jgi:hypothetical protein
MAALNNYRLWAQIAGANMFRRPNAGENCLERNGLMNNFNRDSRTSIAAKISIITASVPDVRGADIARHAG